MKARCLGDVNMHGSVLEETTKTEGPFPLSQTYSFGDVCSLKSCLTKNNVTCRNGRANEWSRPGHSIRHVPELG